MPKKFKSPKKKQGLTKDAIVCLRGFILPSDKGKKGDRFVAFTRDSRSITITDLKKRRMGYKV